MSCAYKSTLAGVRSCRTMNTTMSHAHLIIWDEGDSSRPGRNCSTFASRIACTPTDERLIPERAYVALSITSRFSCLMKHQSRVTSGSIKGLAVIGKPGGGMGLHASRLPKFGRRTPDSRWSWQKNSTRPYRVTLVGPGGGPTALHRQQPVPPSAIWRFPTMRIWRSEPRICFHCMEVRRMFKMGGNGNSP